MNKEIIILVGVPGSGKSTYCKTKLYGTHVRINQDSLGSKDICVKAAKACLESGTNVVIDRCNINIAQRASWVKLAKQYNYDVKAVYLNTDTQLCEDRVVARQHHETIHEKMPEDKKRQIVRDFYKSLELPLHSEGFSEIMNIQFKEM